MENQNLLAELAQMAEQLAQVMAERDLAIQHLAEWAHAVDTQGAEWDNWAEYYKDAGYPEERGRQSIISHLLLAEKKRLAEDAAAPYPTDCRGCGTRIVVRMDCTPGDEWCQNCVDKKIAPKFMKVGADTIYSKG